MKTIAMILLLMFNVNLSALTKQEKQDIKNALDIYLALEKGQDKMKLLLYKQLDVFKKDGKTYKTIDLYLKHTIESQVYFRRLKLHLQLEAQQKRVNLLPYAIGVLVGLAAGVLISK